MVEEFINFLNELKSSPGLVIGVLGLLFSFVFSFRIVTELSEALSTIGIEIPKSEKNKWRRLVATILFDIILVVAVIVYYLSVALRG